MVVYMSRPSLSERYIHETMRARYLVTHKTKIVIASSKEFRQVGLHSSANRTDTYSMTNRVSCGYHK